MNKITKTIIGSIMIAVFSLNIPAFASSFTEDIKAKLEQMGHDKPFASVPLQLSEEEQTVISQLINRKTDNYDHFGNLDGFKNEVTGFMESLGNSRDLSISSARILEKKINEIIQAFNAEAAWVTVRSSHDVDEFDIPRWHQDGYFYSPYDRPQYKIGIVLKGPGTLFCSLSDEGRTEFNTIQSSIPLTPDMSPDEIKAKTIELQYLLAQLIEKYKARKEAPVYQGETNSGIIFIVGDENSAAIHSEPPIHSDRLFVSVLPGTKQQIQELYDNWRAQVKK